MGVMAKQFIVSRKEYLLEAFSTSKIFNDELGQGSRVFETDNLAIAMSVYTRMR